MTKEADTYEERSEANRAARRTLACLYVRVSSRLRGIQRVETFCTQNPEMDLVQGRGTEAMGRAHAEIGERIANKWPVVRDLKKDDGV